MHNIYFKVTEGILIKKIINAKDNLKIDYIKGQTKLKKSLVFIDEGSKFTKIINIYYLKIIYINSIFTKIKRERD